MKTWRTSGQQTSESCRACFRSGRCGLWDRCGTAVGKQLVFWEAAKPGALVLFLDVEDTHWADIAEIAALAGAASGRCRRQGLNGLEGPEVVCL